MKEIPQQLNGSDCGMFACKISVETLVCLLWGCVFRLVAEVYVPSNSWHPLTQYDFWFNGSIRLGGQEGCQFSHRISIFANSLPNQ